MKIPDLKEGESVLLKVQSDSGQTKGFFDALRAHGMRDARCEASGCGQIFLTRSAPVSPELCPPCIGDVPFVRRVSV